MEMREPEPVAALPGQGVALPISVSIPWASAALRPMRGWVLANRSPPDAWATTRRSVAAMGRPTATFSPPTTLAPPFSMRACVSSPIEDYHTSSATRTTRLEMRSSSVCPSRAAAISSPPIRSPLAPSTMRASLRHHRRISRRGLRLQRHRQTQARQWGGRRDKGSLSSTPSASAKRMNTMRLTGRERVTIWHVTMG